VYLWFNSRMVAPVCLWRNEVPGQAIRDKATERRTPAVAAIYELNASVRLLVSGA